MEDSRFDSSQLEIPLTDFDKIWKQMISVITAKYYLLVSTV